MTNNIFASALDEQFKNDCKVINLKYEYPGYTGTEQWAIITDLSENELTTRYSEQIAPYKPFIILPASFGDVRDDYRRNEKKHEMRAIRSIEPFNYDDDLIMVHHPELIVDSFAVNDCDEQCQKVRNALSSLKPLQKQRIIKYFFDNKNTYEIADEEGCSHQAVCKSINAALQKLKKVLQKGC